MQGGMVSAVLIAGLGRWSRCETGWVSGGTPPSPGLDLLALASAESLDVGGSPALTSLSAPALRELTGTCGGLGIFDVLLTTLSLPSLTSACQVSVGQATRLVELDAPALSRVENLFLAYSVALERVDLGALTSVESTLQIVDDPFLPQCWAEALLAGLGRRRRTRPSRETTRPRPAGLDQRGKALVKP